MKFMRQYLLSLLLTFAMASGAYAAADLGNTAVISPTDASNGSGTCPSWLGSAAPSTLDDAGRCLQGAIAREYENRSFATTSSGSANAYIVAYTVAPAAYRTGQVYSFITNFGNTGTATVNINTLGAKTIKKDVAGTLTALSSGDMGSGQFVMLAYNGTDMIWVNWQGSASSTATASVAGISELATTTEVLTGTEAGAYAVTPDSLAALWEAGSDITDGAAITIGEGGYFNLITSTTAITSFSITTNKTGRTFRVRFDTARTLTHNATSLIIPGGANITTAQGDIAQIRSLGSGNVVVDWYTKANGQPVVASTSDVWVLDQTIATSNTATITSATLGATYKEIVVVLSAVAHGSSATFRIAISDDGTNYGAANAVSGAASTNDYNGWIDIKNTGVAATTKLIFGIATAGTAPNGFGGISEASENGITTRLQFTNAAGNFSAGGNIYIYGKTS